MSWARKRAFSPECPKSAITAESLSYLDQFGAWKRLGGGFLPDMNAKDADAVAMLDQLWREEMDSVKQE